MTIPGLDRLLAEATSWAPLFADKRAAFVGCGDSLAAARPPEALGHRVLSAGDVAWTGQAPVGVDLTVALSWSGKTGATVRAAEIMKASGQPVFAITSDSRSPLAKLADHHVQIPSDRPDEPIPTWGFTFHSLAILTALGIPTDAAAVMAAAAAISESLNSTTLPAEVPAAITVTTMPDSATAGEFWSLKLVEATGVACRLAPLEEIGHVDYFIGPQSHLVLIPLVAAGAERADRLGAALRSNGTAVTTVDLRSTQRQLSDHEYALALAIAGGALSLRAAAAWQRKVFRGGEVDMSAQHIQVPAS